MEHGIIPFRFIVDGHSVLYSSGNFINNSVLAMMFTQWAQKWKISEAAIEELIAMLCMIDPASSLRATYSEAAIQSQIRLEASLKGCRLWRNNVGATYTQEGAFIRFGLANESKAINEQIKSADLIGIRPILITQQHVGRTIGQFLSREVKASNWIYKDTDREKAQLRWATLITSLGGDACFANRQGTL